MKRLLLFLLPCTLFAAEGQIHEYSPRVETWVTGPLLTPSAVVVQRGHINVEPYFFAIAIPGFYDNQWDSQDVPTFWNLSWQIPIQPGITEWLDLQITPTLNWNKVGSACHWALGDTVVQFDFQLYRAPLVDTSWTPSVRLSIKETLPTGKYRNLDPKKLRTDSGGFGSWISTLSLGISKAVDLGGHFLIYRANINYSFYSTDVHLKGFNTYGGGFGTDGILSPGPAVQSQIGLEYTLNQNWVLAFDAQMNWGAADTFSGIEGVVSRRVGLDTLASNAVRTNFQYSLAPAIEYNWSADLGLIVGAWFSIAGKNSSKFNSGVIALNYYK